MSAIELRWRRPSPPMLLRWRGLDDETLDALVASPATTYLAALIGPPGPPGSPASVFEHVQNSAVAVWTINHNLGRKPAAVRVTTLGGVEIFPSVQDLSLNQVSISHSAPRTGVVRII